MESYNHRRFGSLGIDVEFVQDNHSFSTDLSTVRGIHLQLPPYAQAKLVRCIAGAILDVAVDLRLGSPTYGHWVAAELSADNGAQLFVPVGFGHGFVTLTENAEVAYKASNYYAPQAEAGVAWDDPELAIEWGLNGRQPALSEKDGLLPRLKLFASPFTYDGTPLAPLE
jgi:dTDP-4-dehydrorhamnose 3,5-epimerase